MRFPSIDRVILFGGAPLLVATAEWLRAEGIETLVYTAPRHAREPLDAAGTTLLAKLQLLGIEPVITDDITAVPDLLAKIGPGTLGIGLGEAWSFDARIIDAFQGRLLDFMGIPLPRYRGGAHYTWMILRGDRRMACNLQVINTRMVQGVYDDGELVKTTNYELSERARIPQDYFDEAVRHEVAFLREFLDEVRRGVDFPLAPPDESRSLYLPRLMTKLHGWIDWSWSTQDIERFVCAFDDPYPGAHTELGGTVVQVKGATVLPDEAPFHPFQAGLVTRIEEAGVVVATRDGHLRLARVLEDGATINARLRTGMRLYTPRARLEAAATETVSYGT